MRLSDRVQETLSDERFEPHFFLALQLALIALVAGVLFVLVGRA